MMMIDDRTTVSDYLVLGTWEAITLLGQARELRDTAEISDMIASAEAILISVVSELPRALVDPTAGTRLAGGLPSLGEGTACQAPFESRPRSLGRAPAKSPRTR
jgi:hypothetical protein